MKPDWKLDGVNLLPVPAPAKAVERRRTTRSTGGSASRWRSARATGSSCKYDPAADGGKGQPTGPQLYNLADDIGEKTDLAAKMPEKVKELQAAWNEWNKGNVAPLWGGGKKK